jgi:hypothetical protein
MPSAHAAVKHELLVRYLDAWLPAAVHRHKRVTYVDSGPDGESAAAAARVFAEFPDLLARHTLRMVLSCPSVEVPPGIVLSPLTTVDDGPVFAFLDASAEYASLASQPAAELLLALPPAKARRAVTALHAAGLPHVAWVELVDASGAAEALVFGTRSDKALETFKNDLWALDEYAGIRYRDPSDGGHTLLDIKLQPNLRPLRRLIAAHLRSGGPTSLSDLRAWALHETIYRTEDATRAVQSMVAAHEAERTPSTGRLSPTTLIAAAA